MGKWSESQENTYLMLLHEIRRNTYLSSWELRFLSSVPNPNNKPLSDKQLIKLLQIIDKGNIHNDCKIIMKLLLDIVVND